ncbi:MAG: extracellular solute-binding protein [bacterium]|nr:extracellular solute-binding protein [bacterium]
MANRRIGRGSSLAATAAAATLLLAACGGGGGETTTTPAVEDTTEAAAPTTEETTEPTTEETTEAPEETETTEAPEAGGDAVELEYIHRLPDGEGMTSVAEIVERWNADNPNIQVTSTKWDGAAAELQTKLETDVNAGNPACLAQVGYSEVPGLFVKGMFEDVTEYAGEYTGNFSDGTVAMMTVGGTVVGLPQDTGPLVYYYNAQAFEDNGLEVPTTTEEFVATAKAAAENDVYTIAFQPDETTFWTSALAASAGASWYSSTESEWVVDTTSEESMIISDTLQDLYDSDAMLVLNRWGDEFGAALLDGSLIGHIGAAWEAPLLADTMQDADSAGNWAVAQLPAWNGTPMSGPDGGSGIGVMKGCEFPAEALEFANWFNTQIDDLVSQGLVVSATTGAMTTPDALSEFYGGQDVFAELTTANENMNPAFPYIPGFASVMGTLNPVGAAAGDGSGTFAEIFETAQTASVQALQDLNLPVQE